MATPTPVIRPADRGIDAPDIVGADLLQIIIDAIENAPRSRQAMIGPSEIGNPCPRALIFKLAGYSEIQRPQRKWKMTVGTAVHAWLAKAVEESADAKRFLVEHPVTIGYLHGDPIVGTADLFDIDTGTVIDWKCLGDSSLAKFRLSGPKAQYRIQGQLYGRGFALEKYVVRNIMLFYVPRDNSLDAGYHQAFEYNESIATGAIERLTGLADMIEAMGSASLAANLFPLCKDWFCSFCKNHTIGKPSNHAAIGTGH